MWAHKLKTEHEYTECAEGRCRGEPNGKNNMPSFGRRNESYRPQYPRGDPVDGVVMCACLESLLVFIMLYAL